MGGGGTRAGFGAGTDGFATMGGGGTGTRARDENLRPGATALGPNTDGGGTRLPLGAAGTFFATAGRATGFGAVRGKGLRVTGGTGAERAAGALPAFFSGSGVGGVARPPNFGSDSVKEARASGTVTPAAVPDGGLMVRFVSATGAAAGFDGACFAFARRGGDETAFSALGTGVCVCFGFADGALPKFGGAFCTAFDCDDFAALACCWVACAARSGTIPATTVPSARSNDSRLRTESRPPSGSFTRRTR